MVIPRAERRGRAWKGVKVPRAEIEVACGKCAARHYLNHYWKVAWRDNGGWPWDVEGLENFSIKGPLTSLLLTSLSFYKTLIPHSLLSSLSLSWNPKPLSSSPSHQQQHHFTLFSQARMEDWELEASEATQGSTLHSQGEFKNLGVIVITKANRWDYACEFKG